MKSPMESVNQIGGKLDTSSSFLSQKVRNIICVLLLTTQFVAAQDSPSQHGEQQANTSQDVNFLYSDDFDTGSLDHLLPANGHIHTIVDTHFSLNYVTPDGIGEYGKLAGLGIHTQVPLDHNHASSTLAKFGFHGLISTDKFVDQLQEELYGDLALVKRINDRLTLDVGINLLHEVSQFPENHTTVETHTDIHGHKKTTTHTETTMHPHQYDAVGIYADIAWKIKTLLNGGDIVTQFHLEHDESMTGNGDFMSLTLGVNEFPITDNLHVDAALMGVIGEGERYTSQRLSLVQRASLHFLLNPHNTVYASWAGIIPTSGSSGKENTFTTFTIGFSRNF